MTKTVNGNANANMLNNGKWIVNMKNVLGSIYLTVLIHFVSRYYRASIHTDASKTRTTIDLCRFVFLNVFRVLCGVCVHVHVYLWTDCVFYPCSRSSPRQHCFGDEGCVGFSRGVAYYWSHNCRPGLVLACKIRTPANNWITGEAEKSKTG